MSIANRESTVSHLQAVACGAGPEPIPRRRPGRPRVVRPAPSPDEYRYMEQVNEARDKAIDGDPLRKILAIGKCETIGVLWQVVESVATESAALRWDREHAETSGSDGQKISSRRVEALSRIAGLVLDGKRLGLLEQDHRSSTMGRVQDLWVSLVETAARQNLPEDTAVPFVERLRTEMAGWQDKLGADR